MVCILCLVYVLSLNIMSFHLSCHKVQSLESLPGHIISTEAEVSLNVGEQGSVPCSVHRTFYTLYWKKGSTYSEAENLLILDMFFDVGEKTGSGFDEGLFDVTEDYSLIIKNVKTQDRGRYFCEVYDFETGLLVRNHTDLTISSVDGRYFS